MTPKMKSLDLLPPSSDLETKAVMRKLAEAHRYLAELKGIAASIPNQNILIDTLILQEARESSAIENIISTFDEVYQSNWAEKHFISPAAKEVHFYARALKHGFELVKKNGILTNNHIIEIQSIITGSKSGFRKLPGTKLLNERTGEIVYTPPQDFDTISKLMQNLEIYINENDLHNADPLIKMAVIHYQFESIHPFYDGNGRTGRIINILYLLLHELLKLPILYLSRYIIRNKAEYYKQLQDVRIKGNWEPWILYILNGVSVTAKEGILMITAIKQAMQDYKKIIRTKAVKLYSQDLLNNLFRYPYTRIEYIMHDLQISRSTAIRYLNELQKLKLVKKQKIGRDTYFINNALLKLIIKP